MKALVTTVVAALVTVALVVGGFPSATASPVGTGIAQPASQAASAEVTKRWPSPRSSTGKWSKRITYRDYTARPNMVRAAFKAWGGAVKGLKFVRKTSGKANINIRAKNCPANTTPCAYYPKDGGTVYMGTWWRQGGAEDDPYDDLGQPLLIHEIGHALGLTHVSKGCSIMYHSMNDWRRACGQQQWPEGTWYCAPQLADAKRIAKKYRVKVRAGVGTCSLAQLYPY